MKLVVGLGNPGRKYEGTRHNIGFDVLRKLAESVTEKPKSRFDAELVDASLGGDRVILLAPQTFMNRSGSSVVAARDFYKLENSSVLVICDDFALPLGKLRFRRGGSSGGQKGLGDIITRLGSQEIPRLRVGISPPPDNWDVADYVLSKFRKDEVAEVEQSINRAAQAVVDWIRHGTEYCMNQYNAN
ncbi:MAG: aminoacyl-tRNA hydrolase [Pirellulaceae bacterium]|nr:aminoacyl-tRNA hydrolase [Planctomycetales bacterium]MCA9163350.1 aminoacyl-tRNA hydrolase [Planctomycetales bacterium]MCA9203393.1 aminoacyl-tRNA hydrolase [Planctomycetales bacterium]MCA9210749.1 aminoacyl-tRNA hydrolase [Planctomycetales bacterium]MCA9224100.1 aminoacyl-tRNA hydrolase [Planctomycetales bacterium]